MNSTDRFAVVDPAVIEILKKYFVFDHIFNLYYYDTDMQKLYDTLKSLKKDVYEDNYRFIFLHYDTEYYIAQNLPGNTIINLQKILESLEIPNYFCIVLSQQHLQTQCQQARKLLTNDDCSIQTITNNLHHACYLPVENKDLDLNVEAISKKYISLNGVGRFHRRVLISLLKHKNLLDDGIVSYLGK